MTSFMNTAKNMGEPNRNVYYFLVCVILGSHGGKTNRLKPCGKNMYHVLCNWKLFNSPIRCWPVRSYPSKRNVGNVKKDANLKPHHYEYLKSRKSPKTQIFSDATPCLLVNSYGRFERSQSKKAWTHDIYSSYCITTEHNNKTTVY